VLSARNLPNTLLDVSMCRRVEIVRWLLIGTCTGSTGHDGAVLWPSETDGKHSHCIEIHSCMMQVE